jgi:hypothetical protein
VAQYGQFCADFKLVGKYFEGGNPLLAKQGSHSRFCRLKRLLGILTASCTFFPTAQNSQFERKNRYQQNKTKHSRQTRQPLSLHSK